MAIPTVRMVLIHTGKILKGTYQQFTTDDLKKMEKAAGFVLNPCTEYGVYGDNYESHYPLLYSQMQQLSRNTFYVGLPPINASDNYGHSDCNKDYSLLSNFITRVVEDVAKMKAEGTLKGSFKGFYFTTERVFGTVDATSPTSNPMVKLMNDLSSLIRKTHKKQFIWAPYLGYNDTYYAINENIGIIANRTNIFNYIFLQSGYYFKDDPKRGEIPIQNLGLAIKSAKNNAMYNFKNDDRQYIISATPVSEKKTSSTIIGIDIEVEDSLYWELCDKSLTAQERTFKKNYANSCLKYSSLFVSGTCPFLFYAGSYSGIIDCNLYETINGFYENGLVKYPTIRPEHKS